jgi:hypothetical protein
MPETSTPTILPDTEQEQKPKSKDQLWLIHEVGNHEE